MSVSYFQFTKLKNKDDFVKAEAGENLFEECQNIISALPYYKEHNFRKNGVMCIDLLFVGKLNPEEFDPWVKLNARWASQYFGNSVLVKQVSAQEDDCYKNHIYVIPLSPRGAVSCDWYCGGKGKLRQMHLMYFAMLSKELNITLSGLSLFLQNQNKKPGHNPFKNEHRPSANSYQNINEYALAIDEYIDDLETKHQTEIQDLKGQISEKLIIENKHLKQENAKLDKYIQPYLDFLDRYGSLKKASKMLNTAQLFQYAIRYYQENGDKASVESAKQILADGTKYMKEHNII